jgi:hypothetical protein
MEAGTSNITMILNPKTGLMERQPTYAELYQLVEDALENLRLMRQAGKSPETSTIVAGYELFDRWRELR